MEGKVLNETPVEVGKPEEGLDFLSALGGHLLSYPLDLDWVYLYLSL